MGDKNREAEDAAQPHGQFLVYRAEDGRLKIDVRLENESVWLTQAHMAELFQTTVPNISMHLRNIFEEGELQRDSVVKEFLTTAADGKNYATKFYNLDAIISVGYRIKSAVATRFRIWATQKLREYIVKGFVLDDERLKNPDQPFDYFEELLRRNTRNSTPTGSHSPTKRKATLTKRSNSCRPCPRRKEGRSEGGTDSKLAAVG